MNIDWLGDVHLGRSFKTGVPLHRLGDREQMVVEELKQRLMNPKADILIQVGDLFDSFKVGAKWVLLARDLFANAALWNTDTHYIVLRGNHDGSRDAEERGAMDLFEALVRDIDNITVVTEPMMIQGIALFPWDPFMTSVEVAEELRDQDYKIAVGHWDTGGYGATSNLIPYEALSPNCDTVVTGHVHTPDRFRHGRFKVHVVGSMQPYSHAEDPDSNWYITMGLESFQLTEMDLTNMNVRLLLKEGEGLPEDVNCLSLVGKAFTSLDPQVEEEQVNIADFDFQQLFMECMKEAEVTTTTAQELWVLQETADV